MICVKRSFHSVSTQFPTCDEFNGLQLNTGAKRMDFKMDKLEELFLFCFVFRQVRLPEKTTLFFFYFLKLLLVVHAFFFLF